MKHVNAQCWVIESVAAEIPIQVGHELEAGSEHCVCNHADPIHILAQ